MYENNDEQMNICNGIHCHYYHFEMCFYCFKRVGIVLFV